ncbi:MAG: chromosome segregation protein SMC [Mariprofundaceae bacterium]
MRLKRIELAGFKSFVDPIKIDFGEGINAIVGPNGCGKSNIVDAIRWVLGEHNARQLRGGVMDDLIFQGSENRAPVAVCDVELSFTVEKGKLPAPYHEMNEISVRRRLTREGGSDAYINGKTVRIKDIVDLFLDTGISSHAYAIVEQGSIARMITAKPEERRLMLEEAAGLMKYRSRRREAERKMNSTRQNLERIADTLEEVRRQCRSLKQQASRAERFKLMQDELQNVQSISLGLRCQQVHASVQDIEAKLTDAKREEGARGSELTASEHKVNEARHSLLAYEADIEQGQDKLIAAEQALAGKQREAERLAGEWRLLMERKMTLEQRMNEAAARAAQIDEESQLLASQLVEHGNHQVEAARDQAHEAVQHAQQAYMQARDVRENKLTAHERLKSEQASMLARAQQARERLARLDARCQQLEEQLRQSETQLQADKSLFDEQVTAVKDAEARAGKAAEELQTAEGRLRESRQAREAALHKLHECERKERSLAGMIQELEASLETRDVPPALRQSLRSMGGKWCDENLDVPEGLELAVAAALRGQRADLALSGGWTSSQIQELKQAIGNAPIAACQNDAAEPVPDNLATAIGLRAGHPLYHMFIGVPLVDDIAHAVEILQKRPSAHVAVGRDGWRLERSGWLTAPSHKHTARALAQQRRLNEAKQQLETASREHRESTAALEGADATLAECQTTWQAAHVSSTESQSRLQAAIAAQNRLESHVGEHQARNSRLQSEREDALSEKQLCFESVGAEEQVDSAALDAAEARLIHTTQAWQASEQQWEQARTQLSAAEQAMALHQQAAQSMQRELDRLRQEQARLIDRRTTDDQLLAQTLAELAAADRQSGLDAALRQAAEQVEQARQTISDLRQTGHGLQTALAETEKHERELRRQLAEVAEHTRQLELRLAAEEVRLQELGEDIQRRCQTTAAELIQRLETLEEPADVQAITAKAQDIEDRLQRFGPVNLLAVEEYQQASERENFLSEQVADLEKSLDTLADTIARINRTTRQRFKDAFEQTNAIFKQVFPRLFGGGRAELRLDSEDVLTAGVEVIAQPPGKRLQDITLLSGGEKALTAVALVFSVFRMKPAPFCILDEVDAPLDDANVGRFGELVSELSDQVQFLTVTHNKITMQMADRLIGVTMPQAGVSRIVGVDMEAYEPVAA